MNNRGFTLIEVMIVIVVVGILAAIAYPSYLGFIQKSRRADARAAIIELQLAQEKQRGNCAFYAQTIANANSCGANAGATSVIGNATSPDGYYALSIRAGSATGNTYIIEADPQGGQAGDTDCDPIVYTANTASPKTPADCWK